MNEFHVYTVSSDVRRSPLDAVCREIFQVGTPQGMTLDWSRCGFVSIVSMRLPIHANSVVFGDDVLLEDAHSPIRWEIGEGSWTEADDDLLW